MYATHNAQNEASGWHYPVILRFEEYDMLFKKGSTGLQMVVCFGDARSLVSNDFKDGEEDSEFYYCSRLKSTSICSGEMLSGIISLKNQNICLTVFLEEHSISILQTGP